MLFALADVDWLEGVNADHRCAAAPGLEEVRGLNSIALSGKHALRNGTSRFSVRSSDRTPALLERSWPVCHRFDAEPLSARNGLELLADRLPVSAGRSQEGVSCSQVALCRLTHFRSMYRFLLSQMFSGLR